MAERLRVRRDVLRLKERDQDLRAGGSLRAVSGSSLRALLRERRGLERPKRESGIGTVSYVRFFWRAPWSGRRVSDPFVGSRGTEQPVASAARTAAAALGSSC